MALTKELVSALATEAKRLQAELDGIHKLLATANGQPTASDNGTAEKATAKSTGGKKGGAKKGSAKPATTKKSGERKARVPLGKAMSIVHAYVHANPGATISDIESAEQTLNRAGITKAIKALEHEESIKEAGKDGRAVKYESLKEPEAEEAEEEAAPSEEAQEEESVEEETEIDPTLTEETEVEAAPQINFG